tara:strand:- start:1057 stop:1713 length:657 start_codon:yes stop_codon:yes gene_type:complete
MIKKDFFKRLLSSIILIPLALFFIIKGSFLFYIFIIICFLIISYEWHNMCKNKSYYFFGYIFLILSFYTIYELIDYAGDYTYFLAITLICVSTDIGGYTFGKIFKGPKLTKISPNKTYSGAIGGFILSILLVSITIQTPFIFSNKLNISIDLFIFIILISAVSQLGDIIISFFKRLSKIKDTGKIIPGHGGLLDRVDGMIFAFPFSYLILFTNLFNNF